jgi:hypothetical protein
MADKHIDKIKSKISKIESAIEKHGAYAYYIIHDDTVKLASKCNDQGNAKQGLIDAISGKEKYIGDTVYEVRLSIDHKYIGKKHALVAGPVSLKIKQYHIDKKYNLKYVSGYKNGAIWYTDEDILNGVFHITDIKKIIKIIHDENVNIISVGGTRAVSVLEKDFN